MVLPILVFAGLIFPLPRIFQLVFLLDMPGKMVLGMYVNCVAIHLIKKDRVKAGN